VAKVKENAAKCVEKILEASRKTGAPMGMTAQTPGGENALPFRGLRSSSVQIIDASEPFEKTRLCPL